MPNAARDLSTLPSAAAAKTAELQTVTGSAIRRPVLLVSVNVVRNLVVHCHVINLRDRQLNVVPSVAAIHRNAHACVVHHRHSVTVRRINPHLVIVPSRARGHVSECVTAVQRPRKCSREEIHFVLIVRRDFFPCVVVRTSANLPVGVDQLPILASVVGAPELPALRGLAVHRHSVASFD